MSKITHYFHTHGIEGDGVKDVATHFMRLGLSILKPKTRLDWAFIVFLMLANLAVFVCFIIYAWSEKYQVTTNPFYGRVEFSFVDNGYPERFGYFLELTIATFFLARAFITKEWFWLSWSAIFIVIFLDDSFMFHEAVPVFISSYMETSFVSSDIIGFMILAPLMVTLLAVGFYFCPEKVEAWELSVLLTIYLMILMAFGVGVDFLHPIFIDTIGISETLLTLIEDGGELITLTLITLTAKPAFRRKLLY
jgi:hypothetical protein